MPYMVIVGEKEAGEGTISVRDRTNETKPSSVQEFVNQVAAQVKNRE